MLNLNGDRPTLISCRVTTLGAETSRTKPVESRGAYFLTSPSLRSFTSIKSVPNFVFHDTQQIFGM
jgi:hypothetical protein